MKYKYKSQTGGNRETASMGWVLHYSSIKPWFMFGISHFVETCPINLTHSVLKLFTLNAL
jgi:hypothetical protein